MNCILLSLPLMPWSGENNGQLKLNAAVLVFCKLSSSDTLGVPLTKARNEELRGSLITI